MILRTEQSAGEVRWHGCDLLTRAITESGSQVQSVAWSVYSGDAVISSTQDTPSFHPTQTAALISTPTTMQSIIQINVVLENGERLNEHLMLTPGEFDAEGGLFN